MENFSETSLLLATQSLSEWKRIAFMAYCCERMIPNYRHFSDATGFGKEPVLRVALDEIWGWIETNEIPKNLDDLVSSCDEQTPNTEDFDSSYTSAALDTAAVIAVTLESLEDPTANKLIEVASLARDTVYMFVDWQEERGKSGHNFTDSEQKIIEHPIMQSELRIQRESIVTLKDIRKDRRKACLDLQAKWSKLETGSLPVINK